MITFRLEHSKGLVLLLCGELAWSLGGMISRFIKVEDSWTVVFWRGVFAATFILVFMLARNGARSTVRSFQAMGLPGFAVACCFAFCSASFVIALSHTTVANVLMLQSATPLIAALIGWAFFHEKVNLPTWCAIAAVVVGVVVMFSGGIDSRLSWLGDGLALGIAAVFAIAIVLTRRFSSIGMLPANALGVLMGAGFGALQAGTLSVGSVDLAYLFAFGAINLGLGLAFFAHGARLVPAIIVALMTLIEPVLGPIWVWLVHGEVPATRTLIGGAIILAAILVHVLMQSSKAEETIKQPKTAAISS
jgi:drug/metabolite transporter (DMT)-like permease